MLSVSIFYGVKVNKIINLKKHKFILISTQLNLKNTQFEALHFGLIIRC